MNSTHNGLYLVSRTDTIDWDNYSAVVVCAESEEEALNINPNTKQFDYWEKFEEEGELYSKYGSWATRKEDLEITRLGYDLNDETPKGFILGSFHAG